MVTSSRRRALGAALLATALGGASILATTASGASSRAAAPPSRPLRILVTNDDGVAAPGINAVVETLRALPDVEITVVAPATNQSGTGDRVTTSGTLTVSAATTASGYPATAVAGTPGDSVLYAFKRVLAQPPDIVVSGANQGQNISVEASTLSGTIGAGLWSSRLGVPAIAISSGFGTSPDYQTGALVAAYLIQVSRATLLQPPPPRPAVLSINVPTCTTGAVRGFPLVPLGRLSTVTGYTGTGTVTPTVVNRDFNLQNCTSTLTNPVDDVEAFNNGFVALSILDPDLNRGP